MNRANNDIDFTIDYAIMLIVILCAIFYILYEPRVNMEDLNNVMTNFHKDPDYDDFIYVWNSRRKIQREIFNYWLYGISISQPQFIEYAEILNGTILSNSARRKVLRGIQQAQQDPSPHLLDCIWAVYFASGDPTYSKIVKNVADGIVPARFEVQAAASMSYDSIVGN